MKQDYYIKRGDTTLGPLKLWQVLDLYDRKEISDADSMRTYYSGSWEFAPDVEKHLPQLEALRVKMSTPEVIHKLQALEELEQLQEQTGKLKWAIRLVGLILAILALLVLIK